MYGATSVELLPVVELPVVPVPVDPLDVDPLTLCECDPLMSELNVCV